MTTTATAARVSRKPATGRTKSVRAQADCPLRAAIYVRISLDVSGEGAGVTRQEEDARAIIAARGWTLAGVYRDNSISASDSKKLRPGYEQLRRDYAAGLFEALVCYDLDRLTRQPRQLEDWIDAAEGRGLALVTTNGEADLTTDGGRMYARIKAAVARAEIERKGARHRRSLRQRAEQGKAPFGRHLLGYTHTGEIDPEGAQIARRIFTRFYAGDSLRSLASTLTAEGVQTRSGKPWNTRTIRDMLSNPRYAGRVVYQGQVLPEATATWEPLVSGEMFDVIAARLSDPARKTNRVGTHRRYLGSSLYQCTTCDAPVKTVNGGKYFCSGHLIREHRHVDQFVLDVIAARLDRPDFTALLAPDQEDVQPWVAQAEKLRARLGVIDTEYDTGIIDGRRWRSATERVHTELAQIDKQLAARRGTAALGEIITAPNPADAFRQATLMSQRAVIDALCTVKLHRGQRGRMKRDEDGNTIIDPATVDITWR